MWIFGSPSCPILANSACDVEHFCQSNLYIPLQKTVLLPRMKSPHNIFLLSPSSEVFDHPVDDYRVLLVSFLEILFDLIRIRPLSHQAISNCIDFIIAFTSNLLGNVLDVIVIPIFFFIDVCKGRFKDV
jgi:hypothetical protein